MFECNICHLVFESKNKFAGHRSGHVRKGELAKRIRNENHKCEICDKTFESGTALGGHKRFHKKAFEELESNDSRRARIVFERGIQCEICKNTNG